ncbi:MAG: AAA family ATPase [bacterium]|nr:AAA family ATPase [bacterium]
MSRIIGVTGTNGAGKGEVVRYLVERLGFMHYSVSGFITEEVIRNGLSVDRDNMIMVGNDLRACFGPAHIVESLYEKARSDGCDSVIESLRALAEVRRVRKLGGLIIGIDADPAIRYQRIRARRGAKDAVSFDEFIAQERSEMNPGEVTKQDLRGALRAADVVVVNDGTLEELHEMLGHALKKARR